jgi:hypothetical protein
MTDQNDRTLKRLLDEYGRTFAEEAGIKLADKPSPLYRLLVLAMLSAIRIRADVAVAASRELAAWPTPRKMVDATWQQRVDALGRAHYVRYDESTATALGEGAELLLNEYGGDLRRLRAEADGDEQKLRSLLRRFPRVGDVAADIFCREAQAVWPELRPYVDAKSLAGARSLGLPTEPKKLAALVPADDLARLTAALVRVALDKSGSRIRKGE